MLQDRYLASNPLVWVEDRYSGSQRRRQVVRHLVVEFSVNRLNLIRSRRRRPTVQIRSLIQQPHQQQVHWLPQTYQRYPAAIPLVQQRLQLQPTQLLHQQTYLGHPWQIPKTVACLVKRRYYKETTAFTRLNRSSLKKNLQPSKPTHSNWGKFQKSLHLKQYAFKKIGF